jgi:hypothetical protein
MFSFILQNDGPKLKIFWVKCETKRTPSIPIPIEMIVPTFFQSYIPDTRW